MAQLDPSIFGALGARPKSAFDYLQDMAAADDAKQSRQLRGLQLLAQQGQMQDAQQVRELRNRSLAAVQALGGGATDDQRISAMRGVGDYGTAEALEKSLLERQKTGAQVQKDQTATMGERLKMYRASLDFIDTPEGAAKWLAAQYQDPITGQHMASMVPLEQAVKRIPTDPQGFENWRQQNAMGMEQFMEHGLKEKDFDQKARNDLIGPDGQVNRPLLNAKQQVAAAGKTTVSVNTGQKGFDNTLKLRGDFRSEPVYKAHQEMQSAHAQIKQALKQASPAGDLAGATKIMKLLDPGSVVRESELGMAMAASGLLDRVTSYATNILQGTKLTPNQRQDFQRLADALYSESVNQYNTKRGEYEGIATRNGLNVPDVLGSESAQPSKVVDFNSLK